jgi:hypothetical protein
LKWSVPRPVERAPSENAISKKSASAVAGSTQASSSSSSTPVFEKGSGPFFSETKFL